MAGASGGRSLEETPTWAVAAVCFVLVLISIIIEHIIHLIARWLKKKHKRALYQALEKVKAELMLLGFISLLLTVGQDPISRICISKKLGSTWHPCGNTAAHGQSPTTAADADGESRRRLLAKAASGATSINLRRVLAGATEDKCAAKGKVPFVSSDGIHQLHIFIFVLAVFHVIYCILTMALGRAKVCFFRQFVRSVPKVDYLTLRHGFIMAHLAPQSHSKFDFQKYINRSLEEDFKVVVGISPPIWFFAVLFLLFNTHGWYSYLWLPFIPLIMILLVGTKLQVIITKMGSRIQERGEVVKGVPVVEPGDHHFWFNCPRLLLYLVNFVLFQNAFQLAFFAWTWKEFGLKSCFHEHLEDIIIRISMGVLIQILCSYVTLPLYALVTQMGSTMKPTIFDDKVATALRKWHHTARKNIKKNKGSVASPMSSQPTTPSHHLSPVHLLRNHRPLQLASDSLQNSPPRSSNFDWYSTQSPSPSHHYGRGANPNYDLEEGSSSHNLELQLQTQNQSTIESPALYHSEYYNWEEDEDDEARGISSQVDLDLLPEPARHETDIMKKEFSFDRRSVI
ncbi:MLO-like protein 6 [Linum perenne]